MYEDIKKLAADLNKQTARIADQLDARNTRTRVSNYDNQLTFSRTENAENVALANDLQASAQASKLFRLVGFNSAAATDAFVQIWDSARAVAATDSRTPVFAFIAFANRNFSLELGQVPWSFQHGIYVCASSTLATLTLLTSNAFKFNVQMLHDAPN